MARQPAEKERESHPKHVKLKCGIAALTQQSSSQDSPRPWKLSAKLSPSAPRIVAPRLTCCQPERGEEATASAALHRHKAS